MGILKDVNELIDNQIISQDVASNIRQYYQSKKTSPQKRLFIVFGILGAVLVGLGINLIIAHNWDDFSRATKSFFAFLPLVIGQLACVYVILKKQKNTAWRESSTAFLFFAVGASISLISQIYNIPGDLSSFLLTWMLLALPLIYIMKSSITSLLFIAGITYYACETSYWNYPYEKSYLFWPLLLAVLPHYYLVYKKTPKSNFITFHNWMIPLAAVICLGSIADDLTELMYIAYISMLGLFYLVGNLRHFKDQKLINNAFLIIGSLGTIILLLTLSFDWFWQDLSTKPFSIYKILIAPEFIATVLFSAAAIVLLYRRLQEVTWKRMTSLEWAFAAFILIFMIGFLTELAFILINLLVFTIGIVTIRGGARQDHLGILNFGLIIITALTVCRFFDTNISFVIRGVLFVAVGVGFFTTNYWMLKRRKEND